MSGPTGHLRLEEVGFHRQSKDSHRAQLGHVVAMLTHIFQDRLRTHYDAQLKGMQKSEFKKKIDRGIQLPVRAVTATAAERHRQTPPPKMPPPSKVRVPSASPWCHDTPPKVLHHREVRSNNTDTAAIANDPANTELDETLTRLSCEMENALKLLQKAESEAFYVKLENEELEAAVQLGAELVRRRSSQIITRHFSKVPIPPKKEDTRHERRSYDSNFVQAKISRAATIPPRLSTVYPRALESRTQRDLPKVVATSAARKDTREQQLPDKSTQQSMESAPHEELAAAHASAPEQVIAEVASRPLEKESPPAEVHADEKKPRTPPNPQPPSAPRCKRPGAAGTNARSRVPVYSAVSDDVALREADLAISVVPKEEERGSVVPQAAEDSPEGTRSELPEVIQSLQSTQREDPSVADPADPTHTISLEQPIEPVVAKPLLASEVQKIAGTPPNPQPPSAPRRKRPGAAGTNARRRVPVYSTVSDDVVLGEADLAISVVPKEEERGSVVPQAAEDSPEGTRGELPEVTQSLQSTQREDPSVADPALHGQSEHPIVPQPHETPQPADQVAQDSPEGTRSELPEVTQSLQSTQQEENVTSECDETSPPTASELQADEIETADPAKHPPQHESDAAQQDSHGLGAAAVAAVSPEEYARRRSKRSSRQSLILLDEPSGSPQPGSPQDLNPQDDAASPEAQEELAAERRRKHRRRSMKLAAYDAINFAAPTEQGALLDVEPPTEEKPKPSLKPRKKLSPEQEVKMEEYFKAHQKFQDKALRECAAAEELLEMLPVTIREKGSLEVLDIVEKSIHKLEHSRSGPHHPVLNTLLDEDRRTQLERVEAVSTRLRANMASRLRSVISLILSRQKLTQQICSRLRAEASEIETKLEDSAVKLVEIKQSRDETIRSYLMWKHRKEMGDFDAGGTFGEELKMGPRKRDIAVQKDPPVEVLPVQAYKLLRLMKRHEKLKKLAIHIHQLVDQMYVLNSAIEADLACHVCHQVLSSPVAFWPCGHSFCSGCFESLAIGDGLYQCAFCGSLGSEACAPNRVLAEVVARWTFKSSGYHSMIQSLDSIRLHLNFFRKEEVKKKLNELRFAEARSE